MRMNFDVDVDEVLLEHLPRKLSAAPDEAASIPSSLAAFVAFLDEEGLLDERSDPAEAVAAQALAPRRAFLEPMDDPANFGMAKRLFGFAGVDDETTAAHARKAALRWRTHAADGDSTAP